MSARMSSPGPVGARDRDVREDAPSRRRPRSRDEQKDVHTRAAEERLRFALGTRVRIIRKGKGGRIEIDFGDENELHRIYEQLTEKS